MSDILCIYYSRTGHTRRAVKEIAEEVSLTSAAVSSRIDKLETDGMISG